MEEYFENTLILLLIETDKCLTLDLVEAKDIMESECIKRKLEGKTRFVFNQELPFHQQFLKFMFGIHEYNPEIELVWTSNTKKILKAISKL